MLLGHMECARGMPAPCRPCHQVVGCFISLPKALKKLKEEIDDLKPEPMGTPKKLIRKRKVAEPSALEARAIGTPPASALLLFQVLIATRPPHPTASPSRPPHHFLPDTTRSGGPNDRP